MLNVYPSGKGEAVEPLLKIEGDVTLTAFKPALNGGYVLRLFNPCDNEQTALVALPDVKREVSLRSMQVRTLLYKDGELTDSALLDI